MAVAIDYSAQRVDDYGPIPPPEAVLTEDLLPLLIDYERTYRTAWEFSHPVGERGGEYGPWTELAARTNIDERKLYRIRSGECAMVDLGVADQICMGIDRHISEVDVYEAKHLRKLSREQGELVRLVARTRGVVIPMGDKNNRSAISFEIGAWRRKLQQETRACL